MTTARHDWRTDYQALEAMTEDDLVEAVSQLPVVIRERLAQGPDPYRWTCGVCKAFGKPYLAELRRQLAHPMDAADLMWRAFAYHEIPKAQMKRADQQHYGLLANEIYERCIATYRAAGWNGEAEEANA